MMKDDKKSESFWDKVKKMSKKVGIWFVQYPLALLASVGVIIVGTLLIFLRKGDKFNFGGIISSLFGKESDESRVEVSNEVPNDRSQEKEKSDKHGYKQKEVEQLPQSKNPFRDKSKIKINEDGNVREIQLPEGLQDKDVDKVYKTDPETYKVVVKNRPDEKDLDKLEESLKD